MNIITRSSAVLALLMLAACVSQLPTSPRSISKIQSRTMPQDIVADRVVRQLGDILIATPAGQPGVKPVNPLDSLWFWTRPRATDTPDVCQSDQVVFEFTPTYAHDPDADSPTRVSGISAAPRFHLLEVPSPGPREYLTDTGQRFLSKKCAGLNPENLHMISAGSAEQVREGGRLFVRVMALLPLSPETFEFECHKLDTKCRDESRLPKFDELREIENCESLQNDPHSQCTRFATYNTHLTVFTSWADEDGKIIAGNQQRIVKAIFEDLVFLAHSRID